MADGLASGSGCVAVVGVRAERLVQVGGPDLELGELVLRERLRGKKVQGTRGGLLQQGVENGQVVTEGLAGRGWRDDDHVLARERGAHGCCLMGV